MIKVGKENTKADPKIKKINESSSKNTEVEESVNLISIYMKSPPTIVVASQSLKIRSFLYMYKNNCNKYINSSAYL